MDRRLTITVIDHDGATSKGPIIPNRRLNLADHISALGFSVESYPFVWGNEWKDNPTCAPGNFVRATDVNFIHSNNICADALIREFLRHTPTPCVIEYSGGGLPAMNFRKPLAATHCIYPHSLGPDARVRGLEKFLAAVELGKELSCRVFDDYDPILEAKLELLHTCLTPPSEEALVKISGLIRQIQAGTSKTITEAEIKASWSHEKAPSQEFVGSIGNAISLLAQEDDCFSPRYIAILSAIRDYLLPEKLDRA